MKIRTLCMVLSADLLNDAMQAARAKQAPVPTSPDGTVPAVAVSGAPLIEGQFMRSGFVFELTDMPRLERGDMVLFTGLWGDDNRERRVRLHVNVAYLDSTANTWFNVIVVVTPPKAQAQADWTHEGIASVMKQSRTHADVDLLTAEQSVCNAAIIGWEYHAMPSVGMMPVMFFGHGAPPDTEGEPGEEETQTGDDHPG